MSERDSVSSEQPSLYPGPLNIWKNARLTPAEQRIEAQFAEQLQRDLLATFRAYRFRYGRILDTDLARGLSPDWDHTFASRIRFTSAVHNPASAFVEALFAQMLLEPKEAERDIVLFTAGGGGSGKTTAITQVAASLLDRAHLVYDATLSQYAPASEKVHAALSQGWSVVIVYVYRSFPDAVRGVIQRTIETGRIVPLNVLAADHANAPQAVHQLALEFANTDRFQLFVIDNSAIEVTLAEIHAGSEAVAFLDKIRHNTKEQFAKQAEEVLDNEIRVRAGTNRAIPHRIISAFRRRSRRRTRTRTG